MKAGETRLLTLLEGKRQFIIPIYQRTYSWTLDQCEQLWNDVLGAAKDDSIYSHFIGSIVYIGEGAQVITAMPKLLVIDGQQRLTTLSLMLAALRDSIGNDNTDVGVSSEEINDSYLLNKHGKQDQRYKILLNRRDRDTLTRIVDSTEISENDSNRILENYKFLKEQVHTSGVDPSKVWEGITKLVVVDVALEHGRDNPQLIFESLNSTGLDLSQADLIRNNVLMGLRPDDQEKVYSNYWYPMEQSFGGPGTFDQFDRFVRDYLTLKSNTRAIPRINEVYVNFKAHVRDQQHVPIEQVVSDVYSYSRLFVKLAFEKESDKEINRIFRDINTLRVDVAYPFLLEVYKDYEEGSLPREDFVAILKLVESYVFRRVISEIPTNTLNKTFATLSRDIDKSNYLESVQARFLLSDSYRRFPKDDEFWFKFQVRDVYNFRNRNYLLEKLENDDTKEPNNVETYTIEHILPQNENLSLEWRQELGEDWEKIQAEYLHTIGNLTLTGYNSELSDHPFKEKRDRRGGFAESPIRLNRALGKLDHWNKDTIEQRAESLANQAIKIWIFPNLSPQTLEKYQPAKVEKDKSAYSLEDHESLRGKNLELFQQLEKRILNFDASVRREIKKLTIAYKTISSFVDVISQKGDLKLILNMRFDQLDDPKGICRDLTNKGHWGNGDVEARLVSEDQLDYVTSLIRQSYELHKEGSTGT